MPDGRKRNIMFNKKDNEVLNELLSLDSGLSLKLKEFELAHKNSKLNVDLTKFSETSEELENSFTNNLYYVEAMLMLANAYELTINVFNLPIQIKNNHGKIIDMKPDDSEIVREVGDILANANRHSLASINVNTIDYVLNKMYFWSDAPSNVQSIHDLLFSVNRLVEEDKQVKEEIISQEELNLTNALVYMLNYAGMYNARVREKILKALDNVKKLDGTIEYEVLIGEKVQYSGIKYKEQAIRIAIDESNKLVTKSIDENTIISSVRAIKQMPSKGYSEVEEEIDIRYIDLLNYNAYEKYRKIVNQNPFARTSYDDNKTLLLEKRLGFNENELFKQLTFQHKAPNRLAKLRASFSARALA